MGALLATIFFASFQTIFCKMYTDNYKGGESNVTPVYSAVEGVLITLVTWIIYGAEFDLFSVSTITLVYGIINGVILYVYNASLVAATQRGSYAFMNVCLLFGGILVPMLAFITTDPITVTQYIAIAAMLVGCYLMNAEGIKLKNTKPIFYVLCLLLFLGNGGYTVMLNLQEQYDKSQSQEMLAITYIVSCIIAVVQLLFKEKGKFPRAFAMGKKSVLFLALSLTCVAIAQNIMIVLYQVIPSAAVVMSFVSGGIIVLSAICSRILFKEKLTPVKIAGVAVAAISAVALSV